MTIQDKPYTIVVGIDFSEVSDQALDEALSLAAARQAELHVLYVDDHFSAPEGGRAAAEEALSRVEHHSIARMDEMRKRLGTSLSFRKLYSHFRLGSPAEQIVQLASNLDADLVVVGTHGRSGLKRFVLGSEAERVVRLARCPVWIVRPKDHEGLGKVPEIEPPCKDCLAKRKETAGATFWCERHSEHHVRAHAYHYAGGAGTEHGSSGDNTATPV
jgi:nucleotide-binding universal stress UspA family protein